MNRRPEIGAARGSTELNCCIPSLAMKTAVPEAGLEFQ